MSYVDGFVVPVPKKKVGAYRNMARKAGKVWREHGALEYMECVADDVKKGKGTSFPHSVKLKPSAASAGSTARASSRSPSTRSVICGSARSSTAQARHSNT